LTDVSICRQPIFDDEGHLWGFELFGVGVSNEDNPAVSLATGACLALRQIAAGGKKIVIDFSEKGVLDRAPDALPPSLTVIKIAEQAGRRPPILDALRQLKSEGYSIAAGGFTGDPDSADLYRFADIVAIEPAAKDRATLDHCVGAAKSFPVRLLADRIPDRVSHAACRELGFSLFHGPYFKMPETLTVRKLSSNERLRFDLLREIEKGEPDLVHLAEVVQADATISFRLLTYLNSASFAFSQTITSIRQAIALLGWTKVKAWLRVVLLADMSQSKQDIELVRLSAQRGMFLESMARAHDSCGLDPEMVHLVGVFSLLDALLRIPMREIVDVLPLNRKMKGALRRDANNEYTPFLQLAQFMEEAKWPEANDLSRRLNLHNGKVVVGFQTALDWAATLDPG
jgi:EAL and modified HD-GYP domain-containing signal transduction protein